MALITRPQYPTMPVAIYRFLGQPGTLNDGQTLTMSTLLMIVCAVGFLAIERFRYGEVEHLRSTMSIWQEPSRSERIC
jgi:thiamine transport system permease protein